MKGKNELIGVDLISLLLIVTSFGGLFGLLVQCFNLDFLGASITNYCGRMITAQAEYLMPLWLIFYLAYGIFSVLTWKKKNIGRKMVILLSIVGISLFYVQLSTAYFLGNDYYRYCALTGIPTVSYYVLLWIAALYIFTREQVKEHFN